MMTCLSCSDSQPMFHAASVTGVTYSITDTQSSHRCPCKQVQRSTRGTNFTTYVSYSAVNISVIAKNAVGFSPTAVASVGQIQKVDLKSECTCVHACSSGIVCIYPAGCTFGHFQLLLLFFLTSLWQNSTGWETEKEKLPGAVRVSGRRLEAGWSYQFNKEKE